MMKDFTTKNNDSRLILSKDFYGFGLGINFKNAIAMRDINFVVSLDFICIRFWWVNYKSKKL